MTVRQGDAPRFPFPQGEGQGLKFRRQEPIEGFVADFLCVEAKLIVELDGGQHVEQAEYDAQRTKVLEDAGFNVLRFWNNDMLNNIEGVVQRIAETVELRGGACD